MRGALLMHGPNGEAVLNEGVVLALSPNRHLIFTDAFTAGWRPAGPFMVGVFEADWGAAVHQLKALAEETTLANDDAASNACGALG